MGRYRRVQAEVQRRGVPPLESGGLSGGGLGRFECCFQVGQHDPSELGELGQAALAIKQRPTELFLQALDRARERRLRYVAGFGRAGEVERLRQGRSEEHTSELQSHSFISYAV